MSVMPPRVPRPNQVLEAANSALKVDNAALRARLEAAEAKFQAMTEEELELNVKLAASERRVGELEALEDANFRKWEAISAGYNARMDEAERLLGQANARLREAIRDHKVYCNRDPCCVAISGLIEAALSEQAGKGEPS